FRSTTRLPPPSLLRPETWRAVPTDAAAAPRRRPLCATGRRDMAQAPNVNTAFLMLTRPETSRLFNRMKIGHACPPPRGTPARVPRTSGRTSALPRPVPDELPPADCADRHAQRGGYSPASAAPRRAAASRPSTAQPQGDLAG